MADPQVQQNMNSFKETIEECLGAQLTCGKLEEVGIPDIHEYLPYVDEDQNENSKTQIRRLHLRQAMSMYTNLYAASLYE